MAGNVAVLAHKAETLAAGHADQQTKSRANRGDGVVSPHVTLGAMMDECDRHGSPAVTHPCDLRCLGAQPE